MLKTKGKSGDWPMFRVKTRESRGTAMLQILIPIHNEREKVKMHIILYDLSNIRNFQRNPVPTHTRHRDQSIFMLKVANKKKCFCLCSKLYNIVICIYI